MAPTRRSTAALFAGAGMALAATMVFAQAQQTAPAPPAMGPVQPAGVQGVPAGNYNIALRSAEDKALPNPWGRNETHFKMQSGPVLGGASGIDVDRDGKSVWVFQRCGTQDYCIGSDDPPLLKFDAEGNLVTRLLAGQTVYPHGLHIDRDGAIWIADLRTNTHVQGNQSARQIPGASPNGAVVRKFSPEGQLLLTLGTPGVYGNDETHLSQPSDIVTNEKGEIFVADGHDSAPSNNRIVKYDRNGKFIKAWGSTGSAPGQLNCPHAIEIDADGRLLVADRTNNRIQIYDQEGNLLDSWTHWGRVSGLAIDKNNVLYAADSMSSLNQGNRFMRGAHIGDARTGKITAFIPDPLGNPAPWNPLRGTTGMEGIAVGAAAIYVAQVTPPGLAKYTSKTWKVEGQ